MSALEIKTFVQLENKYQTVVVWRRIYAATKDGELINGMVFIIDGSVIETIWEK